MTVIRRVVKPKTRKGRIALEEREPKVTENEKSAVFLRGAKSSDVVVKCMKDLCAIKKPKAVFFSGKNDMRPFDDITPLELFCAKNDSSLFMFGNHNKKRPHNLIIGRMFDYHLLDMIELGIQSYKGMAEFKKSKITVGSKPCLLFAGDPFQDKAEFQRLKNLLVDMFRGMVFEKLNLQALEHVLMFTAVEDQINMRSYRIQMKKSGTKIPRIELEEIGPAVDFIMRRHKLASADLLKSATRQPLEARPKKVKNKERDVFGTKLGRIHIPKQNISHLQTRRTKVLRKTMASKKADAKQKQEMTAERTGQQRELENKRKSGGEGSIKKKARTADTENPETPKE